MFLRHLTGRFRGFSRKHGRILKGAGERPLNTNLREMNPRKSLKCKDEFGVIVTLDPNKFDEKKQQRLQIGDLQSFRSYISLRKHSNPVKVPRIEYDSTWKRTSLSFPPNTKAFLYYYKSPEIPRIGGELRLRVASSDNFASFESGSDLLRPNGQLWSRPLYSVSKYYFLLYEKLREEQLVPDDLHTYLSTLPSKKFCYARGHLLYTLMTPFIINFSSRGLYLVIITEQGVERTPFLQAFSDGRERFRGRPYTGSALARFERSTLPDHEGTRTVVLRFLKIITPVKCVMPLYDGSISCPKEGELHRRIPKTDKRLGQAVWSVNIDKSKGTMIRGLRLLWDA